MLFTKSSLLALLVFFPPFINSAENNSRGVTIILDTPTGNITASGGKSQLVGVIRRLAQRYRESPAIQRIQENRGYTVLSGYCRALAVERAALIGILPSPVAPLFQSLSSTFGYPYITWDEIPPIFEHPLGNLVDSGCKLFSVRPDITQPLIDYITTWQWNSFAYLYGSMDAFKRLQFINQKITDLDILPGSSIPRPPSGKPAFKTQPPIVSGHIDVNDDEVMHSTLKSIDAYLSLKSERNVIIDMGKPKNSLSLSGIKRLNTLITWFRRMGMMRSEYSYLLVDFDIYELNLDEYRQSGVTFRGFHFLDYQNDVVVKFAAEWKDAQTPLHTIASIMDALEVGRSLKKVVDNGLWKGRDSTIKSKCFTSSGTLVSDSFIQRWQPGPRVKSWLTTTEIIGQTGLIKFDEGTCQRTDYNLLLSTVFGEKRKRTIAKWSRHSGWVLPSMSTNLGFSNRMPYAGLRERMSEPITYNNLLEIYRLRNKTLRVVTVLSKPFIMPASPEVSDAKAGRDNFVGYCKDLADYIFSELNLNYEMHLVKDNKFGVIDPDTGEWNGMVGEILRDEADLIIAPLTMNTMRAKVIDFSEPFMNFGLALIIRKPGKTKPGMFSFLSPLKNEVWLRMAAATIIVSLGLRLIAAISPKERKPANPALGFNLGNCIWFSVASFVHQGIDIFPISPGARVFASIWRYVCLVVMAYYTANLAAALSVERLISPINSIKDFAEKKDLPIQIGTLDSGATKDFFTHAKDNLYRTIFKRMEKDPSVYVPTLEAGFERVRTKSYTFVAESKMIEYINHRQPCDTMMVGSVFGSKAYAVGLPSNKPEMRIFKEHVTDVILRLRENQVLAKLYKEWWIEKGECLQGGEQQSSEPLALINLSGVFYILIGGMILAMMVGAIVFFLKVRKLDSAKK
ncbi:unnamed protein product [Hymenolepis diminuta]|uniref:Glutamate receptor n=1 Tax=Hymenolepis diminuta TaxID=6216 RepID=A0A0R3S7X2_HYMDI|nr:unnamed protein product [Hymenolepis diminuta]VUZ42581.1 unnamed protein product [Hymenolepis diminuta]